MYDWLINYSAGSTLYDWLGLIKGTSTMVTMLSKSYYANVGVVVVL